MSACTTGKQIVGFMTRSIEYFINHSHSVTANVSADDNHSTGCHHSWKRITQTFDATQFSNSCYSKFFVDVQDEQRWAENQYFHSIRYSVFWNRQLNGITHPMNEIKIDGRKLATNSVERIFLNGAWQSIQFPFALSNSDEFITKSFIWFE